MVKTLTFMLVAGALTLGNAQSLFSDDFTSGAGNWVPVNTDVPPEYEVVNEQLEVRYTGNVLGILRHHRVFTDFTYSVTVNPSGGSYDNVGIAFCLHQDIGGYYFVIDSLQRFTLFSLPDGGGAQEFHAFRPSSFISDEENTLAVSKSGRSVNLLINGAPVYSFQLPAADSGKVALITGKGVTARFDNVGVASEFQQGILPECVSTDFSSGDLSNWYVSDGYSDVQVDGGVLTLGLTGQNGLATAYTNGDYNGASMRVAARHVGGANGMYGLTLSFVQDTNANRGYRTKYLAFVIDSTQRYGISNPDTVSFAVRQESAVRGRGLWDTLEVFYENGTYDFFANGYLLVENYDPGRDFGFSAAGLYASEGARVEFDNFSASKGSSYSCPITFARKEEAKGIVPVRNVNQALVFDLLGRRIGGNRFRLSAQRYHPKPTTRIRVYRSDNGAVEAKRIIVR